MLVSKFGELFRVGGGGGKNVIGLIQTCGVFKKIECLIEKMLLNQKSWYSLGDVHSHKSDSQIYMDSESGAARIKRSGHDKSKPPNKEIV